jgi:uncharacterized membrane protein
MKIYWKRIALPTIVTLLPIILGIVLYPKLPETIAVHWGINNEPDGWLGKNAAVFGLPVLMALLQFVLCISSDFKAKEVKPKLEKIILWVIPFTSLIVYSMTMYIAMGNSFDVGPPVILIMGILFIVFGNYMPKIPQAQNGKRLAQAADPVKYRKVMKQTGIAMVVAGILILISLFFPSSIGYTVVGMSIVALSAFIITVQVIALGKGKESEEDGEE